MEHKWARGIQQQGKGWSIGFQIKGKRQSMTVYCSQAEAAVVYDLAAIWANKQKGNNPENSTYYNFSILWYPRRYINRMVELPDFSSVKDYTSCLLADGTAMKLVPFDGVEHMFSIRPIDTWKSHRTLQVGVNSRGLHFFSGSFWNCILMEDLEAFGARGSYLQLAYRGHISILADRARQNALAVYHYKSSEAMEVYSSLRRAAERLGEQGFGKVPRDLGAQIEPQPDVEDALEEEGPAGGKHSSSRRTNGLLKEFAMGEGTESEGEEGGMGEAGRRWVRADGQVDPAVMHGSSGRLGHPSHGALSGAVGGLMGSAHPGRAWSGQGYEGVGGSGAEREGEGVEGPSKDELDLFRDFAAIAAACTREGGGDCLGSAAELQREAGGPAGRGRGRRGRKPKSLTRAAGAAAAAEVHLLATAPTRLQAPGRLRGLGRKRRAVSEPVDPLVKQEQPQYPQLQGFPAAGSRVVGVTARRETTDQDEAGAPLFRNVPRRRRTESIVRSSVQRGVGGVGSTVSPQRQGSSDPRPPPSLQTSHHGPPSQHTAQSQDLEWEQAQSGRAMAGAGVQVLRPGGLGNADAAHAAEPSMEGSGTGIQRGGRRGGGGRIAASVDHPAAPVASAAKEEVAQVEGMEKVTGLVGAEAEAEECVGGEERQSAGEREGAGGGEREGEGASPPRATATPQQQQRRGCRQGAPAQEAAEALQPGGYLMSMLSQQPFMPMVPAAMMMAGGGQGPAAGGGGRPMMVPMVGQHPFFSMIGCPPGGVMALCGAGAGSTSSAAGRKSGKRGATAGGGFGVAAGGLGSMPFVIVPGTGMGGGGMMQLPCMPGMQMHMHMPGVQVMHAGVPGGMMHMPMVQPH